MPYKASKSSKPVRPSLTWKKIKEGTDQKLTVSCMTDEGLEVAGTIEGLPEDGFTDVSASEFVANVVGEVKLTFKTTTDKLLNAKKSGSSKIQASVLGKAYASCTGVKLEWEDEEEEEETIDRNGKPADGVPVKD